MRFPAASTPQQPRNEAAQPPIRALVGGYATPGNEPAPKRDEIAFEELPAALDERVRLVGEW